MTDIFIGYARVDRKRVLPLVRGLEALGENIWWDAELTPGQDFAQEIETRIQHARRVLILWSKEGMASHWLRAEAGMALGMHTLVQATLDDARPPLEFSALPSLDLAGWKGELQAVEFRQLLDALDIESPGAISQRDVPRATATREEVAAWAIAQATNTPAAYDAFVDQYPRGEFADEAQRRIATAGAAKDSNIFISYRRGDSRAVARLIYEHLKQKVSPDRLFFDVASIPPGRLFRDHIRDRLIKCSTVIVIIGPDWIGRKWLFAARINSPDDFVRMEVEEAFRLGLRVIPVLTDIQHLPRAGRLPPSLRRLCDIQAASLDLGSSYDTDIELLTAAATDSVRA